MLFLWIFGDNVEHRVGHVPYIAFYLVAGIVASFAQILVNTQSVIPTLGASGALSGEPDTAARFDGVDNLPPWIRRTPTSRRCARSTG